MGPVYETATASYTSNQSVMSWVHTCGGEPDYTAAGDTISVGTSTAPSTGVYVFKRAP